MPTSPPAINWTFIALMALLMSMVAFSIDSMIPALGVIARDLQLANSNDAQLIIAVFFLGMSPGILFFGPFSDSFGRKPAINLGLGIFALGSLLTITADSFQLLLLGRALQGFGSASCRIVVLAIIRDRYSGNTMARIMSLVMILFIMVPALAPAIGQGILFLFSWRAIFVLMLLLASIGGLWLTFGQAETLAPEHRLAFSRASIMRGTRETLSDKIAFGYSIVGGFTFAAFVSYLSTSQQILQEDYGLGAQFPLAFGFLALAIGLSSLANSVLVGKFSMTQICRYALAAIVVCTSLFLIYCYALAAQPNFYLLMAYLTITFFGYGMLFGNLPALALQNLGHIAGIANSVIGALQTLVAVLIGAWLAYHYNGTVLPLVWGFLSMSALSYVLVARLATITNAH